MSSDTESDSSNDVVDSILRKLNDVLEIDFSGYRRSTIERRLQRRIAFLRCSNETEYMHRLCSDPDECQALLHELTVKFSEFYRDPTLWINLEETVFPDVIRRKIDTGENVIRIWTAGSATGEEAYTTAMVLDRTQKNMGTCIKVEITGTDIDERALERARKAEYTSVAIAKMPEDFLKEYFQFTGRNYLVTDPIKQAVSFTVNNLLNPSPDDGSLKDFDIIFCRNVLIYLTRPMQMRVFERLAESLRTDGIMILGTAEVLPRQTESCFTEIRRDLRIYQRT